MKTSYSFLGLAVLCCLLTVGCGTQPVHPNQLNAFDGATYDSLTLAHGALQSLRAEIASGYPAYANTFDESAASYAAAYNAYALYRAGSGSQAALTVAIANLTVSIVALENSFQAGMHASPALVEQIRKKAKTLRHRAAGGNVTVSDILTELEIAAAVAQAIPASGPYAGIAAMVIDATAQALAAEAAQAGQPIDLETVSPVVAI
jgi:hypothetical protein